MSRLCPRARGRPRRRDGDFLRCGGQARTVSPVDVTAVRGSQLTYCVEVAAELLADVEEQTVRSVHQAQRPGRESPDSGSIKPGSETVNNPDPDSFRPQNPQQTRPQPPVERGWADKADSRPPLRGPGGWGGDWYVWHAPDGLRARAATGLERMQAFAEKLGVIEASYASAILGVR